MDNVALRQEVVNIWFFFPAKDNSTDWEASTEKPVQIAHNGIEDDNSFSLQKTKF